MPCSAKTETVEIITVPIFQNAMCKQQFGLMRTSADATARVKAMPLSARVHRRQWIVNVVAVRRCRRGLMDALLQAL